MKKDYQSLKLNGPQIVLADGCFDRETVRICEFGHGVRSDWERTSILTGKPFHMMYLILKNLGQHYDRVVVLETVFTEENHQKNCQTLNAEEKKVQKYTTIDIGLKDDQVLSISKSSQTLKKLIDQHPSETYCIVMNANYSNLDDNRHSQGLQEALLKIYPEGNVAVVNAEPVTAALTENKACFAYFQDQENIALHTLNLANISQEKIQQIQNAAGVHPIVLKPLNNAEGYGVNLISGKELPIYIELLSSLAKLRNKYPSDETNVTKEAKLLLTKHGMSEDLLQDRKIKAWLHYYDTEPFAVWQPYFPSKTVNHRFATFRINCILYPDGGIEYLGGFWKLASSEMGSTPTTDTTVNAFDDLENTSAPLSPQDSEAIFKQVSEQLQFLYQRNIETPLVEHIANLQNHADDTVSSIGNEIYDTFLKPDEHQDQLDKFYNENEYRLFSSNSSGDENQSLLRKDKKQDDSTNSSCCILV